jgi:hypothetical protein
MFNDFNVEAGPALRLEAAGFHLANLEADQAIIYMLAPDLRILYCNKAWDEFASLNGGVGLNREAVLGKPILDVIPEPLRPFYANGFAKAQRDIRPWEHDYECSSPELFRLFHMRVLPLANSYLLVENSLRVEKPHGSERPAMSPSSASYLSEDGILTMCCHCRRTRRISGGNAPIWDWVPAFLTDAPGYISHGLCQNCRAYFYPHVGFTFGEPT